MAMALISFGELSKHTTKQDCWILVAGKVYNATRFLEEHPGGDEVIILATGKDATDDFEDVGHSTSARNTLEEYYIGDIDLLTVPAKQLFTPTKQDPYNPDKSSEFVLKILQFLVPLVILGLAVAVRLYTRAVE